MRVSSLARSTASLIALAAWLASSSCGDPSAPTPTTTLTPVPDNADWPASSPEAEHLDPSRLGDLVLRIRRGDYGNIASLLIVRHGQLAVEEYFNGWTADRAHTMQSVSKSVVSLLVGLAAGAGKLSISDPATQFFPGYAPIANLDERKSAMTVQDLLTMRTGLDWSEDPYTGSPLQQLNDCRCDWLRFVLDWPMREPPGTRWEYVSGGVILLGGVVGAATGMRLDRFAQTALFGPLGALGAYWVQGLPDGLPHGGGGLFLRPRDAAKLGQLVLDAGAWRGTQLIDRDWIEHSTQRVDRGLRLWSGHSFDYASLWWLTGDGRGGDVITASGALGQWIFVSARHQLVVVSTGDNADQRSIAAVEFLFTYVLPSITD